MKRKVWKGIREIEIMEQMRGFARNHAIYEKGTKAGKGGSAPYFIPLDDLEFVTNRVSEASRTFHECADALRDEVTYADRIKACERIQGDHFNRNDYPASAEDCYRRIRWDYSIDLIPEKGLSGGLGDMMNSIGDAARQTIEFHLSESRIKLASNIKDGLNNELQVNKEKNLKYYLENLRSNCLNRNASSDAKANGNNVKDSPISNTLLDNPLHKAEKLKKLATMLGDSSTASLCDTTITTLKGTDVSQVKDSKFARDSLISNVSDILSKF